MNSNDDIIELLRKLNLKKDEATLYLELLHGPNTHLRLAHATGINRTKVYRLAEDLEKRSLVSKRTDDRGTFLVAADPATLEVELVTKEESIKNQRNVFTQVLPLLTGILSGDTNDFVVQTYEGNEGFKQMLWHELKTKDEAIVFGSGAIEELVSDHGWAEEHRARTVKAGYKVREILNPGSKASNFTMNQDFLKNYYTERLLPRNVMDLGQQIVVYNNTVSIYNWRGSKKVGLEIINKILAQTMRQIFEHYWSIAEKP
jgi:sugar-specific transcriptional regulator TrmB